MPFLSAQRHTGYFLINDAYGNRGVTVYGAGLNCFKAFLPRTQGILGIPMMEQYRHGFVPSLFPCFCFQCCPPLKNTVCIFPQLSHHCHHKQVPVVTGDFWNCVGAGSAHSVFGLVHVTPAALRQVTSCFKSSPQMDTRCKSRIRTCLGSCVGRKGSVCFSLERHLCYCPV